MLQPRLIVACPRSRLDRLAGVEEALLLCVVGLICCFSLLTACLALTVSWSGVAGFRDLGKMGTWVFSFLPISSLGERPF